MKFFETSKDNSLKKSVYINLRWIAIIGQLFTVYIVYYYFNFKFDFLYSNLIILIGILSNFYLIYFYKKTLLSDRSALVFLLIDVFQLTFLIYLTGGVVNPFMIFFLLNFFIKFISAISQKIFVIYRLLIISSVIFFASAKSMRVLSL